MDSKRALTGSGAEGDSTPDIRGLLDEAGLELWQAPEGFWAIRLKPVPAEHEPRLGRRRRRSEGRA